MVPIPASGQSASSLLMTRSLEVVIGRVVSNSADATDHGYGQLPMIRHPPPARTLSTLRAVHSDVGQGPNASHDATDVACRERHKAFAPLPTWLRAQDVFDDASIVRGRVRASSGRGDLAAGRGRCRPRLEQTSRWSLCAGRDPDSCSQGLGGQYRFVTASVRKRQRTAVPAISKS